VPPSAAGRNGDGAGGHDTVRAWSFTGGELAAFAVIDRFHLAPGATIDGPAIVREQTTTTYLDRGFRVTVHPSGALILGRGGDA
jgi:N-methylhydantoinase A/oxoprolinase/acetone carboxylase beta subunit